jgi:septum formation protein
MTEPMILASGSRFRQKMLGDAGVAFDVILPDLDERALEAPLQQSGATPEDVARVLAEAKAVAVSETAPGRLVLGCDQTLLLGDRVFHKPATMDEAQETIFALSGQTHQLNSAAVLALDGQAVWHHVAVARMTMRALSPAEIGRYCGRAGETILQSVGAYQIEGLGAQLFERIEGDYWTVVGLPLLPVLAALRERGMLDV